MSDQPKDDPSAGAHLGIIPLMEAPPGSEVRVAKLGPLPQSRRMQLQAYGLAPGRRIRVLQQAPVTVVQADHTELALESDLAAAIGVELLAAGGS